MYIVCCYSFLMIPVMQSSFFNYFSEMGWYLLSSWSLEFLLLQCLNFRKQWMLSRRGPMNRRYHHLDYIEIENFTRFFLLFSDFCLDNLAHFSLSVTRTASDQSCCVSVPLWVHVCSFALLTLQTFWNNQNKVVQKRLGYFVTVFWHDQGLNYCNFTPKFMK